jgi:diguanylate cyclase (GGDEF)-like protein/PAS domain S-box-containing protein
MPTSDRDAHGRLEAVLDAMQEVVVIVGRDGRNRYANSAIERVLGFTPAEVFGSATVDRIHPDDRERVLAVFGGIVTRAGASASVHYRARHRDGRWVPCEAKATNLFADPTVDGLVVTVRDLTDELAAAERFRQIADNATDVIYRLRLDDLSFEYVNDSVTRCTGLTPAEIRSDPMGSIGRIIHPDDLPRVERYLHQDFTAPHLDTVELRWVHRDGRVTWAEHRFTIVRDAAGMPVVIDGIARDISSSKALEEELSLLAQRDDLTGLPNRRALLEIIERRLQAEGSIGVLFIDLDGFKTVNDALGHDAGDHLLVAVAGRLSANIRADDVVVRFAGDEFVVLTDPDGLVWLAARLLEEVSAPFSLTAGRAVVSASIGTAVGRRGDDPTELLRRADQAMYRAKRSGKARIAHSNAA